MGHPVEAWFASFLFTQAVEMPIYMRALPVARWRGGFIAFGASAITHPLVWFVFPMLLHGSWISVTAVSELATWCAEGVYLCLWLGPLRAFAVSGIANALSLGLGLFSRELFGVP